MKDPSRIFRWILLLSSLLAIAFLIAAAIRENYQAEWYTLQRDYREHLAAKATDENGRALLRDFRVELKQISVPQLGAVDRCVSCHNGIDDPRMTGVPLPHRVHSGDVLKEHPADRFGCTVCHHGQGPATSFEDAMAADVPWDYPLLPRELTQSSCLACHDVERLNRAVPDEVALLREGIKLYAEKSCGACHKIGGRGGTLGPALDNVGAKSRHQLIMTRLNPPHTTWRWHQAHFRDPGAVVAGSQMQNPTVTEHEALALTAYMLSLWQRDVPASYLAPDKIEEKARALHREPLSGEAIYRQYCFACHGHGTYGRWDKTFKRFIPAVRGPSLLAAADRAYLEAQISKGRPGTQMPAWEAQAGGLQPAEVAAVVDFLRSGATTAPVAMPTGSLPQGDAGRGAILFFADCTGCHGLAGHGGVGPELANPTFQAAASDAFLAVTIRFGRQGTAMPAFQRPSATGLTDADIADLIAFLRTWRPPAAKAQTAQAQQPAFPSGGTR